MKHKNRLLLIGGIALAVVAAVSLIVVFAIPSAVLEIETPYATIEYPREHEDCLRLRETTENGVYAKTFSAELGGELYDLFTLYFGDSVKGNLYGRFHTDGGVAVYIDFYTPPEGLEQMEQYYAMADGINTVVRSLAANEDFTVEQ